jgi:hypothetical protein
MKLAQMPKQPSSQAYLFKSWISKFPEDVFTTDGKVIYCQAFFWRQIPINVFFKRFSGLWPAA